MGTTYEIVETRRTSPTRLLRLSEVMSRVGLKRTAIYGLIAAGKFPAPVPIISNTVGWVESEVEEWVVSLIAAARSETEVDDEVA